MSSVRRAHRPGMAIGVYQRLRLGLRLDLERGLRAPVGMSRYPDIHALHANGVANDPDVARAPIIIGIAIPAHIFVAVPETIIGNKPNHRDAGRGRRVFIRTAGSCRRDRQTNRQQQDNVVRGFHKRNFSLRHADAGKSMNYGKRRREPALFHGRCRGADNQLCRRGNQFVSGLSRQSRPTGKRAELLYITLALMAGRSVHWFLRCSGFKTDTRAMFLGGCFQLRRRRG